MIAAGFGFRADATADSLRDAYDRARGQAVATCLAAPEDKAPGLTALAGVLNLPVRAIAPDALTAQTTLTQSPQVLARRGTGSVAEAAALAAAGPGARLLATRALSTDRMASCALAEGDTP